MRFHNTKRLNITRPSIWTNYKLLDLFGVLHKVYVQLKWTIYFERCKYFINIR